MADDWFRNKSWDTDTARRFDEKLGRARSKEQHLRIQACALASTHPTVALELLERYFGMPDNFDHAQAHVDRATALKALGRFEEAADAYEAALKREAEFPKLQTQAYLELPILVATQRLKSRYPRVLVVLGQFANRPLFPVDRFLWHAAQALIMAAQGDRSAASPHAKSALVEASQAESGFRYHPTVGLVTKDYDDLVRQLSALGAS